MAALLSSVQSESLSVPGDQSFGLNDHQCGLPTGPETREPDPHKSVGDTQTQPMATVGPMEDGGLVAEGKDLGVRCDSRLKRLLKRRQ